MIDLVLSPFLDPPTLNGFVQRYENHFSDVLKNFEMVTFSPIVDDERTKFVLSEREEERVNRQEENLTRSRSWRGSGQGHPRVFGRGRLDALLDDELARPNTNNFKWNQAWPIDFVPMAKIIKVVPLEWVKLDRGTVVGAIKCAYEDPREGPSEIEGGTSISGCDPLIPASRDSTKNPTYCPECCLGNGSQQSRNKP